MLTLKYPALKFEIVNKPGSNGLYLYRVTGVWKLLTRRQIPILIALLLYWPAIFIATHIPRIPQWVGQVPVSDKTLHFLAYLFLVFLLWFAINPNRKVSWRKPAAWWILFAVVWYGVMDEWLQMYVGRCADVRDFFADLAGAVTGLVLLTIFYFWPGCLILTGFGVFVVTNFLRAHTTAQLQIIEVGFYFCSYAFFSMLWMRYIHHFLTVKPPQLKWLIGSLAMPVGLLSGLEVFCLIASHGLNLQAVTVPIAGILAATVPSFLYGLIVARFSTPQ